MIKGEAVMVLGFGWLLLVATELNMEALVAQDLSADGIWLGRPFNFLLDPQSCAHSHQLLTGHMPQQRRKSIQQWRRQRESQQWRARRPLPATRLAGPPADRRTSQGKHPSCRPRRRARLAWWRSTAVASCLHISSSAAGPTHLMLISSHLFVVLCICFFSKTKQSNSNDVIKWCDDVVLYLASKMLWYGCS